MRTFNHSDSIQARRLVSALLPEGTSAISLVYNHGDTLAVIVTGAKVTRLYEFGAAPQGHASRPDLTDHALRHIADDWRSGFPADSPLTEAMTKPVAPVKTVTNSDEMLRWLREVKRGARCVYFQGELAQFREDAATRIIALQAKLDAPPAYQMTGGGKQGEVRRLQETLDLITTVSGLQRGGAVALTQKKTEKGAVYYATKL